MHWQRGQGWYANCIQQTNLSDSDKAKQAAGEAIDMTPYAINTVLHDMIRDYPSHDTHGIKLVQAPPAPEESKQ